ncbi:cleavage and polyadenylation specificity factor subunit 6-like [Styela clava]
MTDGVDIDLYADVDHEFAQDDGLYTQGNVDLYDDMLQPSSRATIHSNGMHSVQHGSDKTQGDMKFNYQGKKVSIYVGNLTWWTTDKDLQDEISALGVNDLIEIKFHENRANGQSKGFAIVHLASESSSRIVMDKLPGKELHGQTPVVTPCNRQSLNQFEQQSKAQSGNSGGPPPQKPASPPPLQLPPRPSLSVSSFNVVHQAPPALAVASLGPPASTAPTSALFMPPRNRLVLPFPPPAAAGNRPPAIFIPPTSVAIAPPSSIPPPGMTLPPTLMPPRVALPPGMPGPPPPGLPTLIRGPGGILIDPRIPPPRPMMPPISPNQPPPAVRPPHIGAPPLGPPPGFPPPPVQINPLIPPPAAELPPAQETYRQERSQSPPLSDTEVEEIMNRNRAVSSSAISRAVSDASAGDYGSAIETLVTAISLIKQSKVATDERAKVLIGSLQDCLHGVEEKSFGSGSIRKRDRSRDRDREERPRHRESKSRRRDRDRDRDRDRSRSRERYDDREYRERSRERDSGGYSSSRHSDRHRR